MQLLTSRIETIEIYVADELNALFMDAGSGRKILIIEDERALVEVLTYNLRKEGFEVQSATDGQDGLRRAASRAYNKMTVDMFAPYAARFAPVAIIPMHTPEEAIEELEYAVGELGYLPTADAYASDDYTNPQGLAPKVYGLYAFSEAAEPLFRERAGALLAELFAR